MPNPSMETMKSSTAEYHDYARNDIFQLIEAVSIAKSLDVGCGSGCFSASLRKNFSCETWGIEPDRRSHERSEAILTKAIHGTWDGAYQELPKHYFNAIFFNDVLEHMVDPLLCLQQAQSLLASDGKIYASIPNFIFADNLARIVLSKDWRYEDSGILDKTHLRFFTKKSIVRLFRDAGYNLEKVSPLTSVQTWKWRLLLGLSFNKLKDFSVYQYGLVASPSRK